jgi:hypothetical protein
MGVRGGEKEEEEEDEERALATWDGSERLWVTCDQNPEVTR